MKKCIVFGFTLFFLLSVACTRNMVVEAVDLPNEIWVARYDSTPFNDDNSVNDIVVDSQGNAYITGRTEINSEFWKTYFVAKYNIQGDQEWLYLYDVPGITEGFDLEIDSDGRIYVTGLEVNLFYYPPNPPERHDYYITIRLDPETGSEIWRNLYYCGFGTHNYLNIDPQGNIIMTGIVGTYASGYVTIKYDPEGALLWSELNEFSKYGNTDGAASAVDDQGNIYVTGGIMDGGTVDGIITKYDQEGTQIWNSIFDIEGTDTVCYEICIGSDGHPFVVGRITFSDGWDIFLAKINALSGDIMWSTRYNGAKSVMGPYKICLDDQGYVYVSGSYWEYTGTEYRDILILKYDPSNGNKIWETLRVIPERVEQANDLIVDSTGQVFITGHSRIFDYDRNRWDYSVLTMKLNLDGSEAWAIMYDGPINDDDRGQSIALDSWGGVYVAAKSEEDGTSNSYYGDCVVIKYSEKLPPVADANGPYIGNEGSAIAFDASGSFDPDGILVLYEWDWDGDNIYDESSTSPTTSHMWGDNVFETVTLRVTDNGGDTDMDTTTVTVYNVPPAVGQITAPPDPIAVGMPITASADFTDQGILDTHTAEWDWGDGTSSGTVTESDGSGSVIDTHAYAIPGVYTITLTVTDDDGDSGTSTFQYVVVYDPDGGFVTGGGWIDSPPDAYTPEPTLAGKATFGFVAKYKKGTTTPTGNTEFVFRVADLNFHSATYDWLVIAGPKAKFKGVGTINGEGEYGFMLTATDGQLSGGGGVDKFRIKIWDKTSDSIVYDNQMGDVDDADASTELGGGSIVIHKAKK